jgi:excinuclease ABC subunit C
VLDRRSAGLQLLQRVRDEAHRFALRRHRGRRQRGAVESIFDSLPGVGPARKKLLLQHFGTPERFVNAGRAELEAVPGLPPRVAAAIHESLHKAG